jgi:hypothetical protein
MRLKSAYRTKLAVEPPNIPEIKANTVDPGVAISVSEPPAPSEKIPVEPVDEAGEVLKRQLQHLRDSERAQHEHAMRIQAAQMAQRQQAQRPMSREEKLSNWRANGGDPDDISFLESNPEMIDRHDVTVAAAEEAARQGHERGTDAHREATREIFGT